MIRVSTLVGGLAPSLACGLALPAAAETVPMDCARLVGMLEAATGYSIAAPPAGDGGGACVLDGARLKGEAGKPDILVQRLRLGGAAADGVPVLLTIDLGGLKVTPALGARDVDERLRSLMRLQTLDLRLVGSRNAAEDRLELRDGWLALSGGSEATFSADIKGAELSLASVLTGALTFLAVEWKNDGRLLRPAMEAAGEGLIDSANAGSAVDATRSFLRQIADNLPDALFQGEARAEVEQLIAALPQGRGRLTLGFASEAGIGAAQIGIAALSDDPVGPDALARLLAGSALSVDWQPGISP